MSADTTDPRNCVFCKIVRHEAPAEYVAEWPEAIAFKPLAPVTPGHVLVAPAMHAVDFAQNLVVTSAVMARAASLANTLPHNDWNLITSKGAAATQTVGHLHVHLVPRCEGDGLALPWTGQTDREAARPVHYREAADSLDGIAATRKATAPDAVAYHRAEGWAEAARALRSTAQDLDEDTTAATLDRAHNEGERSR
ncbi:hypothetical protein GCM10027447_12600 [Glycomyces halotolerans]